MASSTEGTVRTGSTGRGFASIDPERQGEVPGRMIRTTSEGWSPMRVRPSGGGDWMRLLPERDTGTFEGSSSRRGR